MQQLLGKVQMKDIGLDDSGAALSGEDPMLAIRYQIVVMFMLVASTALTVSMVLGLVRQRCFSPGQQLLLRPSRPQ